MLGDDLILVASEGKERRYDLRWRSPLCQTRPAATSGYKTHVKDEEKRK